MPTGNETPTLRILGCRGVPAAHGGFETFAERLSLALVKRGWRVIVYCRDSVDTVGERFTHDLWRGVERVTVHVSARDPLDRLEFDWHSIRHAAGENGVCLVLGYRAAAFLTLLRARSRPILTNMDGVAWRRPKWNALVKAWFYLNEWIAARLSDKLVADHPAITDHLATRRDRAAIATIPYGGDPVWAAPAGPVEALGLTPGRYLISIARIEPDNGIDLLVRAFSRRPRDAKLVVLGRLDPANAYHRKVQDDAGDAVIFPGAIYDEERVRALRYHARAYLHGHRVGGTNPSLVEALWAGNAVIAHRNRYNLWTAGSEQLFFDTEDECDRHMTTFLTDEVAALRAGAFARSRALAEFQWDDVTQAYETELLALGGYEKPAERYPFRLRSDAQSIQAAAE